MSRNNQPRIGQTLEHTVMQALKTLWQKKNAERHKTLRDKSTLQNSKYQSSMISLFQTEYALSEVLLLLCLTIDMDLQSNSH